MLTMWLARAYDEDSETAQVIRRIVTPAAKFWICKRTPFLTYEAMEVLGGSGYIEESIMPRLYREAPVNSIWEGSGNIMCLDVLRALERTPNAAEVLRPNSVRPKMRGSRRLRSALKSGSPPAITPTSHRRARWCATSCSLFRVVAGQARAIQSVGRILRIAARWRGGAGLRAAAARAWISAASPNVPVLRTRVFRTPRIRARPAQESRRRKQACGEPGRPSCRG